MLLPAAITLFLIIGISMATATATAARVQQHHQHQNHHHHQHQQQRSSRSIGSTHSSNTLHLLEVINPWLSACDLTTGQDFEPNQCRLYSSNDHHQPPFKNRKSSRCRGCDPNQCLEFQESHISAMCDTSESRDQRLRQLQQFRLHQCCERSLESLLSDQSFDDFIHGGLVCENLLSTFLEIDKLASHISCEFAEILERYDCDQAYSLVFDCEDCKSAYREWVCSSLLPYFDRSRAATTGPTSMPTNAPPPTPPQPQNQNTRKIRPCRSICHNVEKKCPYLLPGDRAPAHPTQYAGQSTFLCRDLNIEESGDQKLRALYGTEDCCYKECTSDRNNSPYCMQCPFMDLHIESEPRRPDCNSSSLAVSPSNRIEPTSTTVSNTSDTPFQNAKSTTKCQIQYYERTKTDPVISSVSSPNTFCYLFIKNSLLMILVKLILNQFILNS